MPPDGGRLLQASQGQVLGRSHIPQNSACLHDDLSAFGSSMACGYGLISFWNLSCSQVVNDVKSQLPKILFV